MRVVIVGPGRIGAGYLAPLFAEAGWQVTFAARSAEAADRIARAGAYTVTLLPAPDRPDGRAAPDASSRTVSGFDAVPVGSDGFRRAVADADLVCTAVRVGNVTALAPALADALACREQNRPLDVWTVENGDCAPALEDAVRAAASCPLPPLGVAGAIASTAVGRGCWDDGRPEFACDDTRALVVDATRLRTPVPRLRAVRTTGHYRAELLAKLHVFNAGHAICAYLGWLRGHRTIDEAVADRFLRPVVAGAMLESRRALLAAHRVLGEDLHGPVAEALRRFANPRLADPIPRVARDPLRKLAPGDRLVGPLRAVREATGSVPAHFALGTAAALLYHQEQDPQAVALQRRLAAHGVIAVLGQVCGLDAHDPLTEAVASRYRGFIFTDDAVLFPPAYVAARRRDTAEVA